MKPLQPSRTSSTSEFDLESLVISFVLDHFDESLTKIQQDSKRSSINANAIRKNHINLRSTTTVFKPF